MNQPLSDLHSCKFPKAKRLRKSREFLHVIRRGNHRQSASLRIQFLIKQKQMRLGITVTKKFGKAHRRNRFKRLVREIFRTNCNQFPQGVWLHVRPKANDLLNYDALKSELLDLMHQELDVKEEMRPDFRSANSDS